MIRMFNFFSFLFLDVFGKKHRKIGAFLLFLQLILKQDNENT